MADGLKKEKRKKVNETRQIDNAWNDGLARIAGKHMFVGMRKQIWMKEIGENLQPKVDRGIS